MEVSIVLLISSITLFVGYFIGKKEGLSSGYTKGIYEGAEETLKLSTSVTKQFRKIDNQWVEIKTLQNLIG